VRDRYRLPEGRRGWSCCDVVIHNGQRVIMLFEVERESHEVALRTGVGHLQRDNTAYKEGIVKAGRLGV
jgi:hypothetical protein